MDNVIRYISVRVMTPDLSISQEISFIAAVLTGNKAQFPLLPPGLWQGRSSYLAGPRLRTFMDPSFPPLPSPFPSLPYPSHFPPLPFPSLPLEVGPSSTGRGPWGAL